MKISKITLSNSKGIPTPSVNEPNQSSIKRNSWSQKTCETFNSIVSFPNNHLSFLSALKKPIKKDSSDDQSLLENSIRSIHDVPTRLKKLLAAEKTLLGLEKNIDLRDEALLWRLVSKRTRGIRVTSEFRTLYNRQPDNRVCLLNLCASYFSPAPLMKDIKPALDDLKLLRQFIEKNPNDCFALLIEALMIEAFCVKPVEAISCLEKLYLRFSDYTPIIAVMATLLFRIGYKESAFDYATEAAQKDKNNLQATILVAMMNDTKPKRKDAFPPFHHVNEPIDPTTYYSILFLPYLFRDPT